MKFQKSGSQVEMHLCHTSTAVYDYGWNPKLRRVRIRVSVENIVGGTSIVNRGQFSSACVPLRNYSLSFLV